MVLAVTVAGAQSGRVLNATFVYGPVAVHSFLITTLSASSGGTYDHLHLLAVLNTGDSSYQNSYLDATLGDRNGFTHL